MQLGARSLAVVYAGPDGEPLPAFGPVTFSIASGSFVCLVGPSGCGKSTLIRALAGLQQPTRGEVLLDGAPLREPSPHIGVMFQDPTLMPWRTVRDNVALPLELAGVPRAQRYTAADALLLKLGLAGFALAYPAELSGGMAQRAALGRLLAQKPAVLLLDEPFGALDAQTREQVGMDLLAMWTQERQTALMVTHDINEAVLLADRVLVMSRRPGQIVADVRVPLARPRDVNDQYSPLFAETAQRVRAALNNRQTHSLPA